MAGWNWTPGDLEVLREASLNSEFFEEAVDKIQKALPGKARWNIVCEMKGRRQWTKHLKKGVKKQEGLEFLHRLTPKEQAELNKICATSTSMREAITKAQNEGVLMRRFPLSVEVLIRRNPKWRHLVEEDKVKK